MSATLKYYVYSQKAADMLVEAGIHPDCIVVVGRLPFIKQALSALIR